MLLLTTDNIEGLKEAFSKNTKQKHFENGKKNLGLGQMAET